MSTFTWTSLSQQLLRRLQNRRLLRDSGLLLLANGITAGISLVRTPALTWMLPKDEVGMLGAVLAWLPFVQLLSMPGMDTASYHYIAKGQPWAYRVGLSYRLRWSLLSMLGFGAGALFWLRQGNPMLALLFVVSGLYYPLTTGLTAASGTLAARESFVALFWYRIMEALTDVVGFIPLLAGWWWFSRIVTYYLANQTALAALLVGTTWWLLRRYRRGPQFDPDPADRAEMVRYGRHQTALGGIGVAQSRSDALLVSAFFPLTVMADYSLALLIQSQLKNFWTIYLSVRYPPLVRLSTRRRRRRLVWEGAVVTVGFAAMGALLAVAARLLLPWILPPSYLDLLPYLNWLIAIFVLSMPGFLVEIYFRTEQDEKRQYVMRVAAALLGVALPVALLPMLGLQAIFIGRSAAALLFSGLGVFLFMRFRGDQTPSSRIAIVGVCGSSAPQ